MITPVVEDDFGAGVFSVDAGCEIAISQSLYTDVKKREDVPCCFFACELYELVQPARKFTSKTLFPTDFLLSSYHLGMHTTSVIQHIFGRQTLILTRRWEKFAQREATTFEQLSFLHRCRDRGILPKSLRFKPTLPNEAGKSLARKYGFRVLSAIISDVHHRLQRFEAIIYDLKSRCVSALPEDICENFLQRINATAKHARMKKRADLQEELQALLRPINDGNISTRVVNLSKRILTPAESSLLSKGIRFSHVDAAPTNFLANLESLLLTSSIPEDMRADIRNCATGLLRKR
nr:unnamed protein product [Spirometra erinaceieuropaei]